MIDNRVSATMTAQDVTDVLALLDQVQKKLGFLTPLTPEERQQLLKMGPKSRDFVEKGVELAIQHPELLPRYLDPQEMVKDLELHRQLSKIFLAVSTLYYKINDTLMVAGSEAFMASLILYRSLQSVPKGMGLDDALEDMKKRFLRSKEADPTPTNNNPTNNPDPSDAQS